MAMVLAVPAPQLLLAGVTLKVPLVAVVEKLIVTLSPLPLIVAPLPLYVHE